MKRFRIVWLTVLLILTATYSYASSLEDLRVTLIEGDLQIKTGESGDWMPASINMPLREDDMLWTPEKSRTELQLRNGTSIRLDENTSFQILRLDDGSSQFYLTGGKAYVYFKGRAKDVIQVDTDLSSTRGYESSIFRIDVNSYGDTEVSVLRGYVYTENNNGQTKVQEDQSLYMKQDNDAELGPIGSPDEWEKWNKDRNRTLYEVKYNSQFVPEELSEYSPDLDRNGRWTFVLEYGNVWVPTVGISEGWAPYREGRWTLIGGDYVWVSYEPWGWAPYHYGRWSYAASLGWFWVPPRRGEVYWGPGYVGWVHTPTYVAWVPLAPGEVYYGRGYYGPHSVNITNVNIQQTTIIQKNVYINNAVTVQHNDTFRKGRRVDFRVKENPFLNRRAKFGMPDMKRDKSMFMPVFKKIPERERPPERLDRIRVREIRNERPLVREHNGSVFRPDAQQRPMQFREIKERHERLPDRGIRPQETDRKQREMQRPETGRVPGRPGVQPGPRQQGERKQSQPRPDGKFDRDGRFDKDRKDNNIKDQDSRPDRSRPDQIRKNDQKPPVMDTRPERPQGPGGIAPQQRPLIKPVEPPAPQERKPGLFQPSERPRREEQPQDRLRQAVQPQDGSRPDKQHRELPPAGFRDDRRDTVPAPSIKEGLRPPRESGADPSGSPLGKPQGKKDEQEKGREKVKDKPKDQNEPAEAEQPAKDRDNREASKGFFPGGRR